MPVGWSNFVQYVAGLLADPPTLTQTKKERLVVVWDVLHTVCPQYLKHHHIELTKGAVLCEQMPKEKRKKQLLFLKLHLADRRIFLMQRPRVFIKGVEADHE